MDTGDKRAQALGMVREAMALLADTRGVQPAVKKLYEAVRVDPAFSKPYFHLGELYMHLGNLQPARDHLLKSLALDPTLDEDDEASARAYGHLARLSELAGDAREASRWFGRCICLFPRSAQTPLLAARLLLLGGGAGPWPEHLLLGVRHQQAGRFEEAMQELEQALLLYPDAAFLYHLYGIAQTAAGDAERAVESFEKALTLDPNPRTLLEMGTAYSKVGNLMLEEACYQRAMDVNPQDPMVLYLMGATLYARDRAAATEHLQQALDRAPRAPWVEDAHKLLRDRKSAWQT